MVPSFSAFFSSVISVPIVSRVGGIFPWWVGGCWRALHKRWLQGRRVTLVHPGFHHFLRSVRLSQPWQQHPKASTDMRGMKFWKITNCSVSCDYHVSISEQVPIVCCRVYLFVFESSLIPAFASDRAPSPAPVKPQRKGGVLHEAQIEKTQRIPKVQTLKQLRRMKWS